MSWPHAAVGTAIVYVYLLGASGLPWVHFFYDAVGIRDAGTVWTALSWSPADGKHFLPAAVLGHVEGPLQFLFLNAYYHAIGDLFPLDPATTQLPNTVLALACAGFIWLAGRELGGERAGALGAAVFLLMPWLAVTIRFPWIFVTLSCLLEQATLYSYLRLVRKPGSPRYRRLAPTALALYLGTGLDWPSFLFVLGLFLVLSGGLGPALRNRWNFLPGTVIVTYAAWTAVLFFYGRYYNPAHDHLYRQTLLLYPFSKVSPDTSFPDPERLWYFASSTFGLISVLALLGVVLTLRRQHRGTAPQSTAEDPPARAYFVAVIVWALLFAVPLFKTATSITYAYVIAVPVAVLAGLFLARFPLAVALGILLVLAALQIRALSELQTSDADSRSVLAAAAYLIERRPDLLEAGKVAFFPGKISANVGQYARGRHERLIMPLSFPATRRLTAVGSPEPQLLDFVTQYEQHGEIRADWLVFPDEALSPRLPPAAAAFYRHLFDDRRVAWIAAFRDEKGRTLRLGEVRPGGAPPDLTPTLDADPWAETYRTRYDRISFLRRNVRHIFHY
jgi:hypothetical protein